MSRPGTFERVYAAIKQRLREGELRPGDRLEPALLSDELNASVTPVRDALHRLTGERLVEAPRHEGFRVPLLTETTLRHLYAWHFDLLMLAVMKKLVPIADEYSGETDRKSHGQLSERQNGVFLELAKASGNPEHLLALKALTEKLGPIQRFEEQILDVLESETRAIVQALKDRDRRALRRQLVQYHRRRQRIVPELLAMIQPD